VEGRLSSLRRPCNRIWEAIIKALAIGAVLALMLGAYAEAHGHGEGRRSGLHHGFAASGSPRPTVHDRNIRSGDHFSWRQRIRRS
jgi:hypothetical protein